VGDPVQFGHVVSTSFGNDSYERDEPAIPSPPKGEERDTRIDANAFTPPAPEGNEYVAAHQEAYKGYKGDEEDLDRLPGETAKEQAARIRDHDTGGFPAGA